MNIRTLRADEIECRVQTVKETGCSLLLYKDARCDMRILDEVFGPLGWEREHTLINGNLFCNVRVWDDSKKMWINKQDVGTESYTEKEKGQASDSFKRACFNIGIGRELYTAPFIWITLNSNDISKYNNKINVKTKFSVKDISYNDNKEIVKLTIVDNHGNVRYELGKNITTTYTNKGHDKNDNANDVIVPFGKHKGKSLKEILVEDRSYIEYLSSKAKDEKIRKLCTEMLINNNFDDFIQGEINSLRNDIDIN